MITGVHTLLYSDEAADVRAFFRDVLELEYVDAGDGWLIFRLPPAEVGVHPTMADGPPTDTHRISLMCDDLAATTAELRAKGVRFEGEPVDAGYGITTTIVLPGGTSVQLYQPHHPTAV